MLMQETVKRLRDFSERIYRFVVEAMKEELTFDEPPDEFKGGWTVTCGRCNALTQCVLCVCIVYVSKYLTCGRSTHMVCTVCMYVRTVLI